MTTVYALTFAVSMMGNGLGIYVVCRKCSLRSVANLLIVNMAAADLLVTLSIMPYSVTFLYISSLWFGGVLGHITCTACYYAYLVSIAASVLTILVLSINRFYAIFFPLKARLFRRHKVLTLIIWVSSLIIMSPTLLVYRTLKGLDGRYYCIQMWYWEDDKVNFTKTYQVLKIFHIVVFALLYAAPLLIMTVIHILIVRKLWLRKIPGSSTTDSNRRAQRKSQRKVIKLLGTIVVIFAVCWIPTYFMHYFIYIEPEYWPRISVEVKLVSFWVAHLQSSINPCIYILLKPSFRKKFVNTLKLQTLIQRLSQS